MQVRIDYEPREWQRKLHLERKRFTVVALHRRAGKTEAAIMELLDHALRCREALPLYVYIAPFLKQAKVIAWSRLKEKVEGLRRAGAVVVNEGELSLTFVHNGAQVRVFGADNPDAMRGVRLDGVVLDEVAQIKPEVWEEILQPALSDRLGWALFIGTPNGINLFSKLFFDAQRKGDWHSARYTVYDTGAIRKEEVERLKRDMTEAAFAREYLCDFSASGDDQLIGLSDVLEATRRVYKEDVISGAPRVLGVDVARFGDDRSVLFKRQGLVAYPPMVFRGLDNMRLAAVCAEVIQNWEPDAVLIDHGAGSGVIDRLRQLGHDVVEVPFGGSALRNDLFVNRRAEMWWNLREWVRNGGSIPDDAGLVSELATPVYWFDAQGRRQLEGKDEIKKRLPGNQSTDLADALALTFSHPVVSKRVARQTEHRRSAVKEYDPYGEFI